MKFSVFLEFIFQNFYNVLIRLKLLLAGSVFVFSFVFLRLFDSIASVQQIKIFEVKVGF